MLASCIDRGANLGADGCWKGQKTHGHVSKGLTLLILYWQSLQSRSFLHILHRQGHDARGFYVKVAMARKQMQAVLISHLALPSALGLPSSVAL